MLFLFVLDRVENAASANALLGRRLAAAVAAAGHRVHLLELWDGETPPPPLPDAAPLHTLPFADERLMNELLENGRRDAAATPVPLRLLRLAAHPAAAVAALRQLVLHKPRRTVATQAEIERLDAQYHFDGVLCVCAPYRTAFALEQAKISGKKLLWQLDPYAANRDYNAPGGFAREGRLLDALDAAFITPTAAGDYLPGAPLAAWQGKVHTLGFPCLLPPAAAPAPAQPPQCVFCGSLYPGLREPFFALQLFAALAATDPNAPTLVLAGGGWAAFEQRTAPLRQALGAKLLRPGLLPPTQADALQNSAAVLLSLGNSSDNQLPSKLFGYFATGLPVLHLAAHRNDPALPYLARYPLALVLQQEETGMTDAGQPGTPAALAAAAARLQRWLGEVVGQRLSFAAVQALYPEFTPAQVAQDFLTACG